MKKRVLLYIMIIVATTVTVTFVTGLVTMYLARKSDIERSLMDTTHIISTFCTVDNLDAAREAAHGNDFRVTVIQTDTGEVLFESDTSNEVENHLARPEVMAAIANEPKIVVRNSKTLNVKMYYYALAGGADNSIIVRTAVRAAQATSYLSYALPISIGLLIISSIAAWIVASRLSAMSVERMTAVDNSLKSVLTGNYTPISAHTDEPEFYAIMQETNAITEKLDGAIKALSTERDKLDFIINHTDRAIIALSQDDLILSKNKHASNLLNLPDDAIGKNISYYISQELNDAIKADKKTQVHAVGRILEVAPERFTDERFERLVIISDITEDATAAKLRSEFFSNASHELKTPITTLQGMSYLLLEKTDPKSDIYKFARRINEESERLKTLVADMLDLSELESGNAQKNAVSVELNAACRSCVDALAISIEGKNLTVKITGKGSVSADSSHVSELITNLITNAISYNRDGGKINIAISKTRPEFKGNSVEFLTADDACVNQTYLSVSDTGIGIPSQHLPRLCERFYRVDKSRSKNSGGTGLGLAIVKHIVALYGGSLTIGSSERGTTVIVSLPDNNANID